MGYTDLQSSAGELPVVTSEEELPRKLTAILYFHVIVPHRRGAPKAQAVYRL